MSALTKTIFFIKSASRVLGFSCQMKNVERYHRGDGYRELRFYGDFDKLAEYIKAHWNKNVTIYLHPKENEISIWKASKFSIHEVSGASCVEK